MGAMRYKPSDKVRIKSLDWYNENKDKRGFICFDYTNFIPEMSQYCGEILTINQVVEEYEHYRVSECAFSWTDEMIEGLVEEETLIERVDDNGLPFNEWLSHKGAFYIPDGYELKDENGYVINAMMIVLEKMKKEYPKTILGCCDVLGIEDLISRGVNGYRSELLDAFQKLLICRDAYWKIAGEKMGLDKPWEPDWTDDNAKYSIYTIKGALTKAISCYDGAILTFPTEEMRDAFYENFKELINECKELL